jgi:hypothetical protein
MCKFWSCIVDFDGDVYSNPMKDSHSDIVLPDKYKDNTANKDELQFAKVEIVPPNNDVFEPINEWIFTIDEERKPTWWSKFHEKQCYNELKKFLNQALIINKEIEKLENGRYWVKDSKINILTDNALIVKLLGSSKVGVMRGSSKVGVMRGSSKVGEMRESSKVGEMWGSSNVGEMWGSSNVGVMWGSSNVGVMRESSKVGEMWGSSNVGVMRESSKVGEMWGSSNVGEMRESSNVGVMRGSSFAVKISNSNRIFVIADKNAYTIEVNENKGL